MAKSLEQCRAEFKGIELWTINHRGETFVCRHPDPDTFDIALAGSMAASQSGDWLSGVKAMEPLCKGCIVSHTPEELDQLRRDRRMYALYAQVGGDLWKKVSEEAGEQGKDSEGSTTKP